MGEKDVVNDDFNFANQIEVENRSVSENSSNRNLGAVVGIKNEEGPTPHIFKLSVDCFHEIFDWLSQKDLIAVGQTCKHLQRTAGEFVYFNYAAKTSRGDEDGVYISSVKSNIFSQYIQKISISGDRLNAYKFVAKNCTNSIKYFRAYGTLPEGGFECIKNILKSVEVLEMNDCMINGEFYENYLKYCPNIKSLSVSRSGRIRNKSIIIGTGNEWMYRSYPKLEQLELVELYQLKNNELTTFFQLNRNIKTFSTDSRTLFEHGHSLIQANVKLDTLAVDIYQTKVVNSNNESISIIDSIHNLLIEMHENKHYKHLHLYLIFLFGEHNVKKFLSLNAIQMLIGDIVRINRVLTDLQAIAIWCGDEIENIEQLPFNLPNLKRIYFSKLTCNRIAPFIRHSPKLKQIRIKDTKTDFKDVDLCALNEERKKLLGAQKISIYVNEAVYLATKWTLKTIDFSLIELRRFGSAEWEELGSRGKYFKSF